MEDRTAEIIIVCKGNSDYSLDNGFKSAIAEYLSNDCGCPIEFYKDNKVVNEQIWNAAVDYINNIKDSNPGAFLQEVRHDYDLHNNSLGILNPVDMYEAICIAFQLATVRNNEGYINGFTELNTTYVKA